MERIDTQHELSHAKILGKISPNQCVLLVRIGDILFCDWSHQGRLRAIPMSNKQAPKLYAHSYELFQLRFPTPLDFNQSLSDDPGLLHNGSELGQWQETAREFISTQLSISIPLADLLPNK